MAAVDWLSNSAYSQFCALPIEKQQAVIWLRDRLQKLVGASRVLRNSVIPEEHAFFWPAEQIEVHYFVRIRSSDAVIFEIIRF